MKTAMIAQATQSSPPPSELVNAPPPLAQWSILAAAAVWIAKRGWEYFSQKEESESKLVESLISDLRAAQTQLITDLKKSQIEVLDQINLKQSLTTAMAATQAEAQRALAGQTAGYSAFIAQLTKLETKVDALHLRLDSLSEYFPEMTGRRPKPDHLSLPPHE